MSTYTRKRHRYVAQVLTPALALLVLLGTGCSEKETTAQQDAAPAPQAAAPATAPAAKIPEPDAMPDAAQAAADKPDDMQTAAVDGQTIYQASCQACHAAGVAGAPKLGD